MKTVKTAKDYILAIFSSDPTPKTNMQLLDACIECNYRITLEAVRDVLAKMVGDGILNRHQPNRRKPSLYSRSPIQLVPLAPPAGPIVRASTYSFLTAPNYVPEPIQPLRPGAMAFARLPSVGNRC